MTNKVHIEKAISMRQLLEFEVAFPEIEKLSVDQYLKGGSKEFILNAAAFFLGFKNSNSEFEDSKKFLDMFFRKENKEIANKIYIRIREIEKNGTSVGIINTYSSLKLFECFFSKPQEQETQSEAEFEVNLFKAYLVLNSEFTKGQEVAISSTEELDSDLKIDMIMFCMQYPVFDKTNYDINQVWVTQIIKAIYLFQFLESHSKTQQLLAAFLTYMNCSTWQEYLKHLIPLTTAAIKNDIEAHTDIVIELGERFEANCAFIEKLIVQNHDELDPNDFLTIRAKPFYKVKDGVYRIIFNLFVVEKIFKGVYFLLRDVNKTLPVANKIKEIKSFYGEEFSERILCYQVMGSIYPNNCIKFSGKELLDMNIDAAPDYYVRKGKNILIIESKDFLISADKKMTFNFNIYNEEFGRVLDHEDLGNEKIKSKAIMQLINSIRRILMKDFSADTAYRYREVYIYPVLLTHDHQFDTPGFNELLDFWFQDALLVLAEEGLFIHHVKPLTVVNIDTLIYHQVGFSNSIQLNEMLNQYIEYKKVKNQKPKNYKSHDELHNIQMAKLIPFSLFIDKYFHKKGLWDQPPLLELAAPAIFNEEYIEGESL
jgi:hypothetical protein